MYTHCPECNTYFRVSADQLRAAQGKVRCSNCETVFNALDTLDETLPEGQVTANEDASAQQQTTAEPAKKTKTKKAKKTKEPGKSSAMLKAVAGVIVVLLLTTLLIGQSAIALRDKLAHKYPVVRPHLETLCLYLDCKIGLQQDLEKYTLKHKDIRLHPTMRSAILINANLLNEAEFAQPYPQVELTFSGAQSKVIAQRTFSPQEYLPDTSLIEAGLGPRQSALLVLEVVDPGPEAINFEFEFH
ncbi:MAG: DUF3426 domain-containing protein [Gammaproteobacteria bacterium]|nr:DUF3426 domain-containing protein [Gammaproteobacteria bacterium]